MSIPTGATHVDKDGDYWKIERGEYYISERRTHNGEWEKSYKECFEVWEAKPIARKKTYPGQHEPWGSNLYIDVSSEEGAERVDNIIPASIAIHAIKKMMECV